MKNIDLENLKNQLDTMNFDQKKKVLGGTYGEFDFYELAGDVAADFVEGIEYLSQLEGHLLNAVGDSFDFLAHMDDGPSFEYHGDFEEAMVNLADDYHNYAQDAFDNADFLGDIAEAVDAYGEHTDGEQFLEDLDQAVLDLAEADAAG